MVQKKNDDMNVDHPKVSIIMNCWNGAQYLREAMDSVFNQTFFDWEIVFWDNGSIDDSALIAKSYGPKVRYFRSDKTSTLGFARNKALSKCCGEFIAILDVDDIWMPEKLEIQLKLFKENPDLGMTYSNTTFFNKNGKINDLFNFRQPQKGWVFGQLLEKNFISTETMIFKKSVLDKLAYAFDDRYTIVMDYDLSLRIAYSHEIDFISRPLSKWRMHSESETSRKKYLVDRENQQMLSKLCREMPQIQKEYSQSLLFSTKSMNKQLALEQWDMGNTISARDYLKKCGTDFQCRILYLLTFFLPFHLFEYVKAKIRTIYYRIPRSRSLS